MRGVIVIHRKIAIFTCLFVVLLFICIFIYDLIIKSPVDTYSNRMLETKTYFEPGIPPEGSLDEIYQDTIMSLIYPYVADAIENYYGQPFAHAPWSDTILSIERPNGYRTFYFVIKLEVLPYYGAHNTVGVDHITISIGVDKVKVEKFEHIETHLIPPNSQTP